MNRGVDQIGGARGLSSQYGKSKGKSSKSKSNCDQSSTFRAPGILLETLASRSVFRQPMHKGGPSETGTARDRCHHAARQCADQCMLRRRISQRSTRRSKRGWPPSSSLGKCAFGTYARASAVCDVTCCGVANVAMVKASERSRLM